MLSMADLSVAFRPTWVWPMLAGFLAYLALTLYLYRHTNPPLGRGLRIFLGILRYLALLIILLCLAEPIISMHYQHEEQPIVVFLADNSSSLNTVEDGEAKKKFVRAFLSGELDRDIPGQPLIEKYAFSDTLYAPEEPDFLGRQTALGNSIQYVCNHYKDKNLSAILIASDGLSNYGIDPLLAARECPVPIYAIDLGPQRINRDLRIVDVHHDLVGYSGRPLELEVEVEGRGIDRMELPLIVKSGNRELLRRNIMVLGGGERQQFRVEIIPQEPGVQGFSVQLPVQPQEEFSENNLRNFTVKILKSKKRILLVAQKLNWEVAFLRREMLSSPDYEVEVVILDNSPALARTRFPADQDSLNNYDLVVLAGIDAQALSLRANLLENYLQKRGGSLWFLLSEASAGSGAGAVASQIWPFSPGHQNRYYNDFPFHIALTEEGLIHPVTRLTENPRENSRLWQAIPPFEEHLLVGQLRASAKILAVHPEKEVGGQPAPVIFYSRLNRGKMLVFAAGPLLKLGFLNIGFGGDASAFRQIVQNSISWLTTEEDVERFQLAPDRALYKSGEKVRFQAVVLDENYNPLENVLVTALVKSQQQGDSLIVSLDRSAPGRYVADLGFLSSGDYVYSARVSWEDKVLKEFSGTFRVEVFSLEEETLFLPPDMMRRLSQAGNGKYYTPSDFSRISDDLKVSARTRGETWESGLAGNLWVLLAILLVLSIEWFFRKRLQLL